MVNTYIHITQWYCDDDMLAGDGGDYWVIDTDYTSYTLVYSCSQFLFFNAQYFWILSRTKTLNQATIQNLKNKAAGYGIPIRLLRDTAQNCNN